MDENSSLDATLIQLAKVVMATEFDLSSDKYDLSLIVALLIVKIDPYLYLLAL